MHENEISKIIFDLGLKIHKNLGPGLLESAYEECLFYEISKAGLFVEKQKPMPLIYEEVKSCEVLNDVHLAQVLTYLKLSGCRLGLLINFNTNLFKNGYRRILNGNVSL